MAASKKTPEVEQAIRIPVSDARALGKKHGVSHVVVIAYDEDSETEHVVTWGKTPSKCRDAAMQGQSIKEYLGWPAGVR
jgi:hypothetical protein